MTPAAAFVLGVIVIAFVLMMTNRAPPDIVLLGAAVVFATTGILEPAEAFAGFANTGMLTVGALFVVAVGLRETGAVSTVTASLLGRPGTPIGAITRLTLPVVAASAFLNNTTIVASMMPAVGDWSRRIGMAPSKLLIPLSFASILGGVCTLIGTSTNLVVAGLVAERVGEVPGLVEPGMFDVSPVGIPVALAGSFVLILVGPLLLPDRRAAISSSDDPRRYTMELLLPIGSRLVGQSIEAAGLRHLPGAFLMEIVRDGVVIPAVSANEHLDAEDRLVFVGDVDAMVDLQRFPGLAAAPDQVFKMDGDRQERRIMEAVVGQNNPIIGQTIRDGKFRKRYGAVVIAVARGNERVRGRIGDIVLEHGDVLLLEAPPAFVAEQRTRSDFYLVSSIPGATPPRFEAAPRALIILAALVLSVALDLVTTVTAAFLTAGAMVLTRCCTIEEAREGVDLPVLVAIASAFGIGRAMQVTGLDVGLAGLAVQAGADSPMTALVAVYLLTMVVTELITNNAAAVLAFPIAMSLATELDANPMAFVYTVMIAASASFLSPIGYQTNLMVLNAGGYRPLDYPRVGLPVSLAVGLTTLTLVPLVWPL